MTAKEIAKYISYLEDDEETDYTLIKTEELRRLQSLAIAFKKIHQFTATETYDELVKDTKIFV